LSNFILRLTPYSQYDDKALFSQIAEGDEKAFTELFHTYTPKLLPFVFKLTRNEHLAQEMIQETFLKLWVNRAALVNVNEPASWIFRIAANVSVTFLRKQSNRERLLNAVKPDEASDTVVDKLQTKELTLIINKAVEALPDRRKEIYRLSREQGLNHQQIAEKLQLSTNTVANQIGISLKFIREFINKETGLSMLTLLILFGR
jgi:RNA polymerase sigma-70 factor (family 1)